MIRIIRLKVIRPGAEALATDTMAARRRGFHQLRGRMRMGWVQAARAHGFGAGGAYADSRLNRVRLPDTVHGQAGWLVWIGERWHEPVNETWAPGPQPSQTKGKAKMGRTTHVSPSNGEEAAEKFLTNLLDTHHMAGGNVPRDATRAFLEAIKEGVQERLDALREDEERQE
jgi:hypothetical protein